MHINVIMYNCCCYVYNLFYSKLMFCFLYSRKLSAKMLSFTSPHTTQINDNYVRITTKKREILQKRKIYKENTQCRPREYIVTMVSCWRPSHKRNSLVKGSRIQWQPGSHGDMCQSSWYVHTENQSLGTPHP
mgnify:CR=1 FL=1